VAVLHSSPPVISNARAITNASVHQLWQRVCLLRCFLGLSRLLKERTSSES